MRFDLSDLRLFLNVAESASITAGASATNVAAASASERIKSMENEIGTPLLHREHRGVRPTAAGSTLMRHARLILEQNERMRGELAEFSAGLKGVIRLLSNTAALSEFLPQRMTEFLVTHPNIDLEITERQSGEIVQAIASGEYDIGIVADIVPIGDLESIPFALDQLVVVVPDGHLFCELEEIEFKRALTQDMIGLMRGSALMDHLDAQAARLMQGIHWRVRVSSFDTICRIVQGGVGVAVVPETAARRAQKFGRLKIVKLADPWATRHLTLCVRDQNSLSNPARELVEHIRLKT